MLLPRYQVIVLLNESFSCFALLFANHLECVSFRFAVPHVPSASTVPQPAHLHGGSATPSQSQPLYGTGFVQNPESALVPVAKQVPTLTPTTVGATATNGGGGGISGASNYTVGPRARRPSEKVADGNLIDLEGLGQSLDK